MNVLPPPCGIVTLLTDFGSRDFYVGILEGAVLKAHVGARIVHLGHAIPAQDVSTAALHVEAAIGRFPTGTVHVVVVDPGVGTDRRMLAVSAHGCYWIAPDNGVLSAVFDADRVDVRVLDPERLGIRPVSRTFHGRDVFAPIAGRLARGQVGFGALGLRIEDAVRVPVPGRSAGPEGRVVLVDHFGNLITDLGPDAASSARGLSIAGSEAALVGTYGERGEGELVALLDSFDRLEVAIVGGSAAERLGVGVGTTVRVLHD